MPRKTKLLVIFSALLLTMCRFYDQGGPVTSTNGLSCQGYTEYRFFEWGGEKYRYYIHEKRAECSYVCPDGTVRQPDLLGKFSASSPLYSASKEELDLQFCGITPQPTPTQTPAITSTPAATASPTAQASPTAEETLTPPPPLLTGLVTMCSQATNLISFRIVQPPPDLTSKTLTVLISDLESTCAVNPSNLSLLTCTLPTALTFPTRIVVSLDGTVVNDFTYDGTGCIKPIAPTSTFIPTPTP